MSLTQWIIAGAWLNLCAAWGYILWLQIQARRAGMILTPVEWESPGLAPSVAVIVAARDEIDDLGPCVQSILRQRYPAVTITIVDDRSSDGTAELADTLAARNANVRAIHVDHLPAGWLGKSHAVWTGAQQADGAEWLLFTDADCRFEPLAVATAIRSASDRQADLFTLWPAISARSFWEHALIPLCAAIIALWFGCAADVKSPSTGAPRANPGRPFANGQFILMRSQTYHRINGHAAVSSAIIEDVPLAEHAAQCGAALAVASGAELFNVRMYDSFASIHRGWSRIYIGALRGPVEMTLSILWLAAGSLLPFVALPYLLITPNAPIWPAICAAHLLLIGAVSYRFWGMGHCSRRYLIFYPLLVVLVISVLIRSLWIRAITRRCVWRGRSYRLQGRRLIACDVQLS